MCGKKLRSCDLKDEELNPVWAKNSGIWIGHLKVKNKLPFGIIFYSQKKYMFYHFPIVL